MTRTNTDETSTDTSDVDTVLTKEEFNDMGWPADMARVDSGVDRVYMISSSLRDTGLLDVEEAQALAFHDIADVGRQRTADEVGMSTSEVDRTLRSARRKVADARELVEILDDCNY